MLRASAFAACLLILHATLAAEASGRAIRFGPARAYPSGVTRGACLAAGDLNGDGYPDLVVTDTFNHMTVLLNKGDGTFQLQSLYSTDFYVTGCVVLNDFNGDGKLDALIVGGDAADNGLAFFAGNGDGTFTGPTYTQTYLNASAISAALGDLNKDGNVDLFVGGNGASQDVFGDGKGNFQDGYPQNAYGFGVILGDFNGDGNLDAATAGDQSNKINVLLGNGDGTFQDPQTYEDDLMPTGITTGDFNGDGKLDLAVTQYNGVTVLILLGNGDGTFTTGDEWLVDLAPGRLVGEDFNKDGILDLAVSNYNSGDVSVLQGIGNAQFAAPIDLPTGTSPSDVVAADFNHDGSLDLATVNNVDNTVSVLPNAAGTFIKMGSSPNPSNFGQRVVIGTSIQGSIARSHVATGTVIFRDGSTIIARKTLASGKVGFATSTLSKGRTTSPLNILATGYSTRISPQF